MHSRRSCTRAFPVLMMLMPLQLHSVYHNPSCDGCARDAEENWMRKKNLVKTCQRKILSVIYTHRHSGKHFPGGAENICPENNNLPKLHRSPQLNIHCVLNIFSPLRIFEQLALALKNRVCPENFHCIEYTFYKTFLTFEASTNCREIGKVGRRLSLRSEPALNVGK